MLLVPAIPLVHAQVEGPSIDTLCTSGESPLKIQREVLFRSDTYEGCLNLNTIVLDTDNNYRPLKADSHIACRSHAAPMPFPCHALPLRV